MLKYFKQHIFGRLALLFAIAGLVLVVITYYVVNWAVTDKDTILDIHDLYYHYKFVDSWDDFSDTSSIRGELSNLKLKGRIYYTGSEDLCPDDYVFDFQKEQASVYWQNTNLVFSICDYISYQDSKHLKDLYGVSFPAHVSFGDVQINGAIYPATVIEKGLFRVLLVIDYIYPSDWITFLPLLLLSIVFVFVLYIIIRGFLRPISLMENRILDLEGGDLESQIPIIGEDELALLSKNFNVLIKEIKKLLAQKERLLSDVSHEIKTPLAKIRLLLAMEPTKDKVKQMDRQIQYLDSIVTNILISDKLSAPYAKLEIEKINIETLLSQGIDLSKHDNVSLEMAENFYVYCDVVKMVIVIKNLLDNASKYAVSNKGVILKAYQKKPMVFIECVDFGKGISDALIKNITLPFVRGENLKKSGFGLGLSICKKIVTSHAGRLSVQNNINGGASFIVSWENKKFKV